MAAGIIIHGILMYVAAPTWAAALTVAAGLSGWLVMTRPTPTPAPLVRLSLAADPGNPPSGYSVSVSPDGTRVDLTLVLELSGPLRFAGGMVRGRAEREARENLERLKALLEA